jgi:hypothetical protein
MIERKYNEDEKDSIFEITLVQEKPLKKVEKEITTI